MTVRPNDSVILLIRVRISQLFDEYYNTCFLVISDKIIFIHKSVTFIIFYVILYLNHDTRNFAESDCAQYSIGSDYSNLSRFFAFCHSVSVISRINKYRKKKAKYFIENYMFEFISNNIHVTEYFYLKIFFFK